MDQPSPFPMPQPWRRSEIIEISDSDESDDSWAQTLFPRESQQLVSQQSNRPSLFPEHVAPVSITVTQNTTRSDPAAGSSSPLHETAANSRSRTPVKGKGKAQEVISTTTSQACESSSSQRSANRLPPAVETRPDDHCMFA